MYIERVIYLITESFSRIFKFYTAFIQHSSFQIDRMQVRSELGQTQKACKCTFLFTDDGSCHVWTKLGSQGPLCAAGQHYFTGEWQHSLSLSYIAVRAQCY